MSVEVAKKENKQTQSLKYLRDKDREMVRGKFRYHEVPGGTFEFVFKKYKQDPVEKFAFIDEGIYTIPRGVAKHLNNNCWYPIHSYTVDEHGKPTAKVGQKVHRTSFQSLEFIDDDADMIAPAPLVTVERV